MNAASLPVRKTSFRPAVLSLRWAAFLLIFAGVLAVTYAGFVVLSASVYQDMEMRKFERPAAPLLEPHQLNLGEVIGEIQIPSLRLKAIVVQGADLTLLDRAVGHLPQTPLPGEWGNVALAAHRDSLFRPLRNIHQGDTVIIETSRASFQYEVQSTFVVPATQIDVLRSAAARELTLITCFPFNYLGRAPDRFIVRAREVASRSK